MWMALVALAAIVSRAVSFSAGLVFDDHLTVMRNYNKDWISALAAFTSNQSGSFGSNFYRPVLAVWEGILQSVIGHSVVGWHVAGIAIHVASALLVFRLMLKLAGRPGLACAAATLFAVHPAHVEGVGWISAMGDPLMTFFLLLATVCLLRWLQGGAAAWYAGSLLAAAACVLTKEPGVVMPLLVLPAAWVLPAERRMRRLSFVTATPYFLISMLFLLARRLVLPAFSTPIYKVSTAQMIATWPSALLFYLRHMAWPEAVVPFYPLRMASGFSLAEFWMPLVLLLAIAAAVIFALWRLLGVRRAVFCVVWTVLPLAPALMLKVFANFELVHDRFLYLPLVGFCISVAWLLYEATRRMDAAGGARIFLLCVAGLAVVWCLRSLSEELWWRNDPALYTHALAITPDNPRALVNLGDAYMSLGRLDAAAPYFARALQYDPASSNAYFGLGLVAYRKGNFAEAELQLAQALRLQQRSDEWEYLARTELKLGKLDLAERAAAMAVSGDVSWPGPHEALGEVLLAKGDRTGAAAAFAEELRIDPASQTARAGLAQAQGR